MLAIFSKELVSVPEELHSSSSAAAIHNPPPPPPPRVPVDIRNQFISSNPPNTLSFQFGAHASLSFVPSQNTKTKRLLCGYDEMYCVFLGNLTNLCSLIKQYGLSPKSTNEAMLVIEAYRTLRDRGPYPAHQVLKDLDGSFGFVIFDAANGAASVFAAVSGNEGVELFWGVGGDGSVVICDEKEVVKSSCGKSFAAFPRGCMFHSEGGLSSFEHPRSKMMAMPRIDSQGAMCGADFKVDAQSFTPAMPRVGSEANWALRGPPA